MIRNNMLLEYCSKPSHCISLSVWNDEDIREYLLISEWFSAHVRTCSLVRSCCCCCSVCYFVFVCTAQGGSFALEGPHLLGVWVCFDLWATMVIYVFYCANLYLCVTIFVWIVILRCPPVRRHRQYTFAPSQHPSQQLSQHPSQHPSQHTIPTNVPTHHPSSNTHRLTFDSLVWRTRGTGGQVAIIIIIIIIWRYQPVMHLRRHW